jgi:hypothetical protein
MRWFHEGSRLRSFFAYLRQAVARLLNLLWRAGAGQGPEPPDQWRCWL